MDGAALILRAAERLRHRPGVRLWRNYAGVMIIAPPSASSVGKWQLTFRAPEGQATIGIFEHRREARAWARRMIAAA